VWQIPWEELVTELRDIPVAAEPRHESSASFLGRVLEPPSYGFLRGGTLYSPTQGQLWRELLRRLNIMRSKRQWLPLWSWVSSLALLPFLVVFLRYNFGFWPLALGLVYSLVVLGTHGTVYLHRYCTHRAFAFRGPAWLFVWRHLVIKIVSEELYVVSHHVHHRFADKPGDPYNAQCGWLYCFLADVNHQPIATNLTDGEYHRVSRLLAHTGLRLNSYEAYVRWGSLTDPARTIGMTVLNWMFWYGVFFLIGGHALATAIFGASFLWAFGIRTFNFNGHGRGRDVRREGYDFDRNDLSVNQLWPGYLAGEWHNNHHLYPTSARSGFLPHQLDLAWLAIRAYGWLGGIARCRDNRADFYRDYYEPYLIAQRSLVRRDGVLVRGRST
jgi:stearoyl-CoA desaturase (delta-9 desaturase)